MPEQVSAEMKRLLNAYSGKESWMAALEKENYLKAAEMSMEDDYGMIDGIINNSSKEDKSADAKSPEKGKKSSIMDRLKSAKAEKQKERIPSQRFPVKIPLHITTDSLLGFVRD